MIIGLPVESLIRSERFFSPTAVDLTLVAFLCKLFLTTIF